MKLFARYNRLTLPIMVMVFVLSGIAYYFLLQFVLVHELDEDLHDKRKRIARYVREHQQLPATEELEEVVIHYTRVSAMDVQKPAIVLAQRYDAEEKHTVKFRELTYTQPVGYATYRITIAKPLEGIRTLQRFIIGLTLGTILLVIIVSVLLNRLLLRRLWQPFYKTMQALRDFKVTHAQQLVLPDTDTDEFRFLNDNLTKAINEAHQEYKILKEFTENASHELQTPLAILRSKLDLLIQSEDLSEKQSELLRQMYDAIKKLSKLNQSLLLLARIENRQYATSEPVDLQEKLQEKTDQFRELWRTAGIAVHTSLEACTVKGNAELMEILLNNLLSNAGRHNVPGGNIYIQLTHNKLMVMNTGRNGALDINRVFRRFAKEEQYASSNGLGLSLVKEICHQSGIKVQYGYNEPLHIFSLHFP